MLLGSFTQSPPGPSTHFTSENTPLTPTHAHLIRAYSFQNSPPHTPASPLYTPLSFLHTHPLLPHPCNSPHTPASPLHTSLSSLHTHPADAPFTPADIPLSLAVSQACPCMVLNEWWEGQRRFIWLGVGGEPGTRPPPPAVTQSQSTPHPLGLRPQLSLSKPTFLATISEHQMSSTSGRGQAQPQPRNSRTLYSGSNNKQVHVVSGTGGPQKVPHRCGSCITLCTQVTRCVPETLK